MHSMPRKEGRKVFRVRQGMSAFCGIIMNTGKVVIQMGINSPGNGCRYMVRTTFFGVAQSKPTVENHEILFAQKLLQMSRLDQGVKVG